MESGSGFNEEEQMGKGKLPFSYSSSSSPSSSSSHQKGRLVPVSQIYDKNEIGSWLGNKFDPEEDNDTGGCSMDVNEDEDAKREGGGGGEDQTVGVVAEKEHMFDKVVTPSDVGKLNRLVIPKQHAERHFPLDSSANEKGLLLNFEDRNGKEWRFRYSYWNSSQSYVMTKGWSRFVKEKKLDAGDVVSFQRGVGELGRDRLYIDWRRRPDAQDPTASHHHHLHHHQLHHHFASTPWSPLLMRPPAASVPLLSRDHVHLSNPNRNAFYTASGGAAAAASSYDFSFSSNYNNVVNPSSGSGLGSVFYVRSSVPNPQQQHVQQVGMGMVQWQQGGGGVLEPTTMVYESVPVVQGKAAAKRLRLFGVNMDCPITANDQSDHHHHQEPDSFSSISTSIPPHHSAISLQPSQLLPQSQLPPQFRLYNGTPLQAIPSPQYLHNEKPSMSLDLDI